jgi:acetoin utilization deacetylase AcuC-like enzyme
VKIVYSPRYEVALPGHIWPTSKYRLTAEALQPIESAAGSGVMFVEPSPAAWEDLALVHTAEYLGKLRDGRMTAEDIATLELPWVPELADAFQADGWRKRLTPRAPPWTTAPQRTWAADCTTRSPTTAKDSAR